MSALSSSFRSDSGGSSARRIAVIGAQTAEPESAHPYTVYRTVTTFDGQCYERLVRYSEFLWFYKRLKFRNKAMAIKTFPKKKWTRKASLTDEVIEARQVMLNEFMKEVCKAELTPESEQCLQKLLKIGKFQDGSGRVSELRTSLGASFLPSDRGDRSATRRGGLDVVHEVEEESEKHKAAPTTTTDVSGTLTLTSLSFPAISSNATTVLADDERSAIGSQSRLATEDLANEGPATAANSNARSAPHKSVSSIPPSAYSADLVLNRPPLKASQSLPQGPRPCNCDEAPTAAPASAPAKLTSDNGEPAHAGEDGYASPDAPYRERVNSQMGIIMRLITESEAETKHMESAQSMAVPTPMPLTA